MNTERSLYLLTKDRLEQEKCPNCMGLGQQNNAEPGDIGYDTWECKPCKGTGFLNGDYWMIE